MGFISLLNLCRSSLEWLDSDSLDEVKEVPFDELEEVDVPEELVELKCSWLDDDDEEEEEDEDEEDD